MVEAVVEDIAMSGEGNHFLVLLRTGEKDILPIVIDALQAMSLVAARLGEPPERPNTHDLMLSSLQLLGATISRVEISELREGTYYGVLVLERGGVSYEIDARPSDALALALRCDCRIFVAQQVLDQQAYTDDYPGDEGSGFEA
jgi:bifunctional DNase/RNase